MTEERKLAEEMLAVAVDAARRAGELQKERLWGEHQIDFKGETDLVTEVDRQCEELAVAAIRAKFPHHDILAEENRYPSQGSDVKWIIDPVDGTTNYAHGFPWFCISIGIEVAGEMAVGVINHVMMNELFTTVRGAGAFLNGTPISVSGRQPLRQSLLATGFPYNRRRDGENNFDHFTNFQLSARGVRRAGAAALDLAYVACGRFEGFWESNLKPWDVSAGKLLVEEAGGRVTNYAGGEYSIYSDRILASNGIIHQEMMDVLAGKVRE